MKIETILDAAIDAYFRYEQSQRYGREPNIGRYCRQYHTFRARILRMDREKDEQEAMLRLTIDELYNEIEHLKETCCHD